MRAKQTALLIIGATILCIGAGATASVTIQIPPSKDNTLYQSATGSLSNGSGERTFCGKTANNLIRRGLMAFDVAGNVPAGSTINSVRLRLWMSMTAAGPQTCSIHRVTADWGEGTTDAPNEEGQGAASTAGSATWIHRFHNTVFWATAGGDFVATASASQVVDQSGQEYFWGSTPQMVADVQGWLNNPGTNFGWLMKGNEAISFTAKRFESRETTFIPLFVPYLEIQYTAPVGGPGDMNCDGNVDPLDVVPFVLALTDPAAYGVAYPTCNILYGDLDSSGAVRGPDIQPFVDLLIP